VRRRAGRRRRVDERRRADPRRVEPDHVVGVALQAKLFGRFRLLTLDAVVDVARPRDRRLIDLAPGPAVPDGRGRSRADVEDLLEQARAALPARGEPSRR
jgi:hypothetical protein